MRKFEYELTPTSIQNGSILFDLRYAFKQTKSLLASSAAISTEIRSNDINSVSVLTSSPASTQNHAFSGATIKRIPGDLYFDVNLR